MIRKLLVFLITLLEGFFAFSSDTITGKIIMYREYNYQSALVPFKVYVNDSLVIKLKNNSYFVYDCAPGKTIISVKPMLNPIEIDIVEGKTYYLRFGIRMGFWTNYPELLLVDSISAKPAIYAGSMRQIRNDKQFVSPKNKVQVGMQSGFGVDDYAMLTTTNGDESKISFGGGLGFFIEYSHQANKFIELSTALSYQFSELVPVLDNASVSFKRTIISFTPYLNIPNPYQDYFLFKVGLGADYYSACSLNIETSKVSGGFDDIWLYNNSFGFHLGAQTEFGDPEGFSVGFGLNYYYVKYKFKSSGLIVPSENDLKLPDGSGLNFIMGLNYHF